MVRARVQAPRDVSVSRRLVVFPIAGAEPLSDSPWRLDDVLHRAPMHEGTRDGARLLRDRAAGAFHLSGVLFVDLETVGDPEPGETFRVSRGPLRGDLQLEWRDGTPLLG